MATDLTSNYHGVNSLTQAVSQAKLIDKFLQIDQEKKKEIIKLKSKLQEIETDFTQMQEKVSKVSEEKAALEKLVLEILNFGEQCESQYDKL